MMRRHFIFLIIVFVAAQQLRAQCPDRQQVYYRITELKHSTVPPESQRTELARYLEALNTCPQQRDTVLAYLLQRMGALYGIEKKFDTAVAFSVRSIGLEDASVNTTSKADFLVRVYHNLQMFYDSLHLLQKKVEAVDSCVSIAVRWGRINGDVVYNAWQRSYYSSVVGDYQRCLDYADIGDAITRYCTDSASRDFMRTAFFNMRINSLTLMARFADAQIILRRKIEAYTANHNEKACGIFYNQLSEISTRQKHYDSALYFLRKSLICNRQTACMYCCKQTYNNIGFLYHNFLGDPARALPYYAKAIACINNEPQYRDLDVIESLNIYDNMATAYTLLHKFDSAQLYYPKAFSQLGAGIDEQKIAALSTAELMVHDNLQYIVGLIKDRAYAFVLQYNYSKDRRLLSTAITTFKIADRLLTRVKAEQAESVSGIAWRANARDLYEKAIYACFLLNETDEAFYFFEKSRSAFLMDKVNFIKRSSLSEIVQQNGLKRQIETLKARLRENLPGTLASEQLQGALLAAMRENDRVSLNIKKRDPLYYHSVMDTSFISVRLVSTALLKDRRSLMEIFYGDSAVYVLYISNKGSFLKQLDKGLYDRLTADYLNDLSRPDLLNSRYGDFLHTSHELYSLLFAGHEDSTSALLISPDGQNFPFESLVKNISGSSPAFLLYDKPISYAYSALHLMSDTEHVDAPRVFMGMAPVDFELKQLSSLPASDKSLETVASLFHDPLLLTNEKATRRDFLEHFDKYAVIQLYTHATESGSSGEPEIFFHDSVLRLSDLDPLFKPATKLIVLSACQTGNGNFYKSEGVFSFNRAFAAAGIPSSVVNLWSVDNQAVYRLTELFYAFLAKGLPLDVSMQQAKIQFIVGASRDRTLPYYWASAIVVGDAAPVVAMRHYLWQKLFSAVVILICLSYLATLYHKKN